jgi:uncharacterized membrane protein YvbJ
MKGTSDRSFEACHKDVYMKENRAEIRGINRKWFILIAGVIAVIVLLSVLIYRVKTPGPEEVQEVKGKITIT